MKNLFTPVMIITLALVSACASAEPQSKVPSLGSDRDKHGCIGSAGYTWSKTHNKCVQIWVAGHAMNPADSAHPGVNYYAIINDKNQPVEIFIPGKGSFILKGESPIWKNDKYVFSINNGNSIILENSSGKIIASGTIDNKPNQ